MLRGTEAEDAVETWGAHPAQTDTCRDRGLGVKFPGFLGLVLFSIQLHNVGLKDPRSLQSGTVILPTQGFMLWTELCPQIPTLKS